MFKHRYSRSSWSSLGVAESLAGRGTKVVFGMSALWLRCTRESTSSQPWTLEPRLCRVCNMRGSPINRVVMKWNAADHQTNWDSEISSGRRHFPEPISAGTSFTSVIFGVLMGKKNLIRVTHFLIQHMYVWNRYVCSEVLKTAIYHPAAETCALTTQSSHKVTDSDTSENISTSLLHIQDVNQPCASGKWWRFPGIQGKLFHCWCIIFGRKVF